MPAYRLDLGDPRAPTEEQWAAMSEAERAEVVDQLPSRRGHLSAELPVYDPGESWFAP